LAFFFVSFVFFVVQIEGELMAVRVQIPTPMRQHTEGNAVVEADGGTVQAVLDDLGRKYPGIAQRLFENGQVRRFVNVYLNDEDIRYLDSLATAVKDGDELSIIPAVAGG
jgi:MoaD family protein